MSFTTNLDSALRLMYSRLPKSFRNCWICASVIASNMYKLQQFI